MSGYQLLKERLQSIEQMKVVQDDGYLRPFLAHFQARNQLLLSTLHQIQSTHHSLLEFARSYKTMGLFYQDGQLFYREWAPAAKALQLYGQFNSWKTGQHTAVKDKFGTWTMKLPTIPHNSKIKARVLLDGGWQDRIPAWIRYAVQDQETKAFDGVHWNPETPFKFNNKKPRKNQQIKIYECHIGMSGISPHIHSYKHFTEYVIPRVKDLGYNTLQIMAIMEHPYYGSFGYQVSNFYAVSSRFGTPDQFKELVDTAHGLGIRVLIDLIHSHAATNVNQGINMWDGTDYQYFHALPKGRHQLWDSRLFDYGKYETQRFLISNVAFLMDQYQVDGFRFDGITSMLYEHHGIGFGFTGDYRQYFSGQADLHSLVLLALQNLVIHQIDPQAVTIAQDVSGYPTLSRPVEQGGIGFDYRFAMAVADLWIKLLKEQSDQHWHMGNIVHTLTNRRYHQKCICYSESHDQALVGDKTLSMWLFDKQIYTSMSKTSFQTITINRGMALHKLIRLISYALGGEGYLCFMGNEFGHPEWIDFPREGNGWSFHYCRRRWDLADDPELRFSQLLAFDKAMNRINGHMLVKAHILKVHQADKVIIFSRGQYLFVFNFHPTNSYTDYLIPEFVQGCFNVFLATDRADFGGHSRTPQQKYQGGKDGFKVYLPNRTALVFKKQ